MIDSMQTRKIVNQWTKRSSTIGRNVSIVTGNGCIIGKAIKIDNDGALIISKGKKVEKILAGDIRY
jgi:BirA family biotin operon repressor/biotin-[acetyl-CoA-carboxylase] ligase